MIKEQINITNIEDFFHALLYDKLTTHLFFTSLPLTIQSDWEEMVLVDISDAIQDKGGAGNGMIAVYNYAKPKANGTKNSAKLSQMDKKLEELIQSSKSEHYFISRYKTYSDYDSDRNLHCNITLINLQIV